MTGQTPFPNVPLKQLKTMINDGYRPGVPNDLDEDIAKLIISCWNIDPTHRPSFPLIFSTLTRLCDES